MPFPLFLLIASSKGTIGPPSSVSPSLLGCHSSVTRSTSRGRRLVFRCNIGCHIRTRTLFIPHFLGPLTSIGMHIVLFALHPLSTHSTRSSFFLFARCLALSIFIIETSLTLIAIYSFCTHRTTCDVFCYRFPFLLCSSYSPIYEKPQKVFTFLSRLVCSRHVWLLILSSYISLSHSPAHFSHLAVACDIPFIPYLPRRPSSTLFPPLRVGIIKRIVFIVDPGIDSCCDSNIGVTIAFISLMYSFDLCYFDLRCSNVHDDERHLDVFAFLIADHGLDDELLGMWRKRLLADKLDKLIEFHRQTFLALGKGSVRQPRGHDINLPFSCQ